MTTSALELARELGHERVVVARDAAAGLLAVIAIHDSTLGTAVGGTRMRRYPTFDDAVVDALRLSHAMTRKCAFAGMPYGGAKAVILADPLRDKTPELLEAYGRVVEELGGRFMTGCDMGIEIADLAWISRATRHVGHTPASAAVDASDLTAIGVVAALRSLAGRSGQRLAEWTIALQGVGEVGRRLAQRLASEGSRLVIADAVAERAAAVAAATGARVVAPEAIFDEPCDAFSPNAAGGTLDRATLARLRAPAICGAANNPLAGDELAAELARRSVIYAPDFVVNAGGVLSLLLETGTLDEAAVVARVERIGADLAELLDLAAARGTTPLAEADRKVADRLAAARAARH
jgi:leucine dehydrogenase